MILWMRFMSKVSIIMGSKSDLKVAEKAIAILDKFGVQFDINVASAHRTPARVEELVKDSDSDVFIAIAGLSAALPGVVASFTVKPVIGVPVSGAVNFDALLSVVQMPPGIRVAAVGLDRGDNAAVLAVEMLTMKDASLAQKLRDYRAEQAAKVLADSEEVRANILN
jgi:5-(carboxyamino)imidazole ribonucleotide mutase